MDSDQLEQVTLCCGNNCKQLPAPNNPKRFLLLLVCLIDCWSAFSLLTSLLWFTWGPGFPSSSFQDQGWQSGFYQHYCLSWEEDRESNSWQLKLLPYLCVYSIHQSKSTGPSFMSMEQRSISLMALMNVVVVFFSLKQQSLLHGYHWDRQWWEFFQWYQREQSTALWPGVPTLKFQDTPIWPPFWWGKEPSENKREN